MAKRRQVRHDGFVKGFPHDVSFTDAGHACGVSRQAVAAWDPPRNEHGRLDLPVLINWRIEKTVELALTEQAGSGSSTEQEYKERLQRAKAEMAELDLAAKLGAFCRREEIEEQWCAAVSTFSVTLQNLPASLAPRLEGQDAKAIEQILERALRHAVDEMKAVYEQGDADSEAV